MARRLKPSEKQIQASILEHWRTLGMPRTLVAAIPNAGSMGQAGLTKGLPDLMVIGPRVPGNLAFIELKKERGSHISEAQLDFVRLCHEHDVSVVIAYGRDEPIKILEQWAVVRRAAA